jgi:hypothetical protein
MKVFNLQCSLSHPFEGWFGSEDDYQAQQEQGLLLCPLCADPTVVRLPSAPRLNLRVLEKPNADVASSSNISLHPEAELLANLRQLIQATENVGTLFPEQARQMHNGDLPKRSIRGHATTEEVNELLDEGVPVLSFPMLPILKETLQ